MVDRDVHIERLSRSKIPINSPVYLEHHFFHASLRSAIAQYARGKLLDIGCGNKPYEDLLIGKIENYVGCDIVQSSENKVDVIAPANHIPLESNMFDTVFSTQTIEHVGDCQGLVNEAFRLLKPGGYFIVSGPMYWPLHEEPYDFYRFTKHGFKHLFDQAGLQTVEIIPNGGKWALMGQVIFHTLPSWVLLPKIVKIMLNKYFAHMDKKYFDPTNTMNYVAVAQKPNID